MNTDPSAARLANGNDTYCQAYLELPFEFDKTTPPLPAPLIITNNDDEFVPGFTPFVVSGFFSTAGQEVGSRVVSSLLDRFVNYFKDKFKRPINAVIPEPLTPKEQQAFDILYSAESFSAGVSELLEQLAGLEPHEAVELSFKFLYRHSPKHPLAKANPHPYILRVEDVKMLMERYDLKALQIYNMAWLVHDSYGWEKEHIWSNLVDSIMTANLEKVTGQKQPEMVVDKWTDTQESFLKNLMGERLRQELSAFKRILEAIVGEIEKAPLDNGQIDGVMLWDQFPIDIGPKVVQRSMGRMALVEHLEGLIAAIDRGRPLSTEEEAFLTRLKEHNPPLQKIIESKTHFTKTAINGTNLALDMLKDVKHGRNLWFARVLMEVAGSAEPITLGVILMDNNGKETARYEFGYNTTCPVTGRYISLYKEGEPHPFGPFSFKQGHVLVIKGNVSSVEHAIQVTAGNQRSFFITNADLQLLREKALEITSKPAVRRSPLGRAYLRFFNRVQAIAKMTMEEDFVIETGTDEQGKRLKAIEKMADRIANENWSALLEHELDKLGRRFNGNLSDEALEAAYSSVGSLRSEFTNKFSSKNRKEFIELTQRLRKTIANGDAAAKNTAIAEIKQLIARQLGGSRLSDQLSWDLYGEFTAWRNEGSVTEKAGTKEPSDELRAFIAARGVDGSLPPSLKRAREYRKDGSVDRALLEYERVSLERSAPVDVQLQAMSEGALLAAQHLQFPRAKRLVTRLRLLEARGIKLSEDAKMVIGVVDMIPANGGPAASTKGMSRALGEVFVVTKMAEPTVSDPYTARLAADAKAGNQMAAKELERVVGEDPSRLDEAAKVLELGTRDTEEVRRSLDRDIGRAARGWRFWERFGWRGRRGGGRGGKKGTDRDAAKRARML